MQVLIKGDNPLDIAKRCQALQYFQDKATTKELENLVKLAKGPMRSMLSTI
jgi:hypothetical protein